MQQLARRCHRRSLWLFCVGDISTASALAPRLLAAVHGVDDGDADGALVANALPAFVADVADAADVLGGEVHWTRRLDGDFYIFFYSCVMGHRDVVQLQFKY